MTAWLLDLDTYRLLEHGYKTYTPTAADTQQFEVLNASRSGESSRILTVAGDQAEIQIDGMLTDRPDIFAMIFGGGNVLYSEVARALQVADASSDISQITLNIDSPGGTFDGLFDLISAMEGVQTPMRVAVGNMCASAAYAIACASRGDISARHRGSRVGSVGVVGTFTTFDNETTITSTNAPKKRPDPETSEGREAIRETLDAMHDLFVEVIATGRNRSVRSVNTNFGEGATLLAEDAQARGMIDSVGASGERTPNDPQPLPIDQEPDDMTPETLAKEHPECYAAVVEVGIKQERDRVGAFVIAAQHSGLNDRAFEAITGGEEMTLTLQSEFLFAAQNRQDVQNRQDDDSASDAASASAGQPTATDPDKAAKDLFAAVGEGMGVQMNWEV